MLMFGRKQQNSAKQLPFNSKINKFLKKIKKLLKSYFYLFLAALGLHCCTDFSVVVVSKGYSLVAVHGSLIVVASLVAGHGL